MIGSGCRCAVALALALYGGNSRAQDFQGSPERIRPQSVLRLRTALRAGHWSGVERASTGGLWAQRRWSVRPDSIASLGIGLLPVELPWTARLGGELRWNARRPTRSNPVRWTPRWATTVGLGALTARAGGGFRGRPITSVSLALRPAWAPGDRFRYAWRPGSRSRDLEWFRQANGRRQDARLALRGEQFRFRGQFREPGHSVRWSVRHTPAPKPAKRRLRRRAAQDRFTLNWNSSGWQAALDAAVRAESLGVTTRVQRRWRMDPISLRTSGRLGLGPRRSAALALQLQPVRALGPLRPWVEAGVTWDPARRKDWSPKFAVGVQLRTRLGSASVGWSPEGLRADQGISRFQTRLHASWRVLDAQVRVRPSRGLRGVDARIEFRPF